MADNRTVLITGASTGIGRATADLLADDGWQVFGTSRMPEQYHSHGFEMLRLDVTDDDSVQECVGEIMHRAGRIDALVNNAGYGLKAMIEEASIAEVRALFEVNYYGVLRMCRAVLPIMREQGGGHIVNVSSLSGIIPTPPSGHYVATKHALEGMTDVLAHEVRGFGIHVTLVQPGPIRTKFSENIAYAERTIDAYDEFREKVKAAGARNRARELPASVRGPRLRYTCSALGWMGAHLRCWLPERWFRGLVGRVLNQC